MKAVIKTQKFVSEVDNILQTLGLSEYETKAYKSLLKYGALNAGRLAKIAEIPLPRIYDVAMNLQRKGLIMISKSRPRIFKIIPVKTALNNFMKYEEENFMKRIKALEENIKNYSEVLEKITKETGEINEEKWYVWSIEKKTNIANLLNEQKNLAKQEIKIFSGDASWIRWKDVLSILKNIKKHGIRIRVLINNSKINEEVEKNVKNIKKLGIEIREGYKSNIRGQIIDNKIASIVFKKKQINEQVQIGKTGTEEEFEYEMLTFTNENIVNLFSENFEFWWERGKEV
ncbi:MAG: helix-turn-helix domain-containing protein [Candidatus Aenigmatarchaeota archaeon]|nr:hypothetical protein [Candidatus Aenigmarchaeota archaeon]